MILSTMHSHLHHSSDFVLCVIVVFMIIGSVVGEKQLLNLKKNVCENCEQEANQQQAEITQLQKKLSSLESEINLMQKKLDTVKKHSDEPEEGNRKRSSGSNAPNTQLGSEGGGVTYIRYGRTTCVGHSTVLYKGHVGGNWYLEKGGGVNYLCLHENPEWGNRIDGLQGHTRIYGTEFDSRYYESIFSKVNNGGQTLQDLDILCVACYVPTRSAQIMIPARRTCPVGWSMEYRGYLVTEGHGQNIKDFICMDEEPEGLRGSYANNNGALLYPVEGVCGSLPCPPYVHGWEITCVVCTK